jgi:hypothetical protein
MPKLRPRELETGEGINERAVAADIVAWSLWRRAHQAAAQKSHIKQESQL